MKELNLDDDSPEVAPPAPAGLTPGVTLDLDDPGRFATKARTRRRKAAAVTYEDSGPSFVECFDTIFRDWFDLDSWRVWRVVAKSIFAEDLTPDELVIFTEITGRTDPQTTPAREVWVAAGRRAGKDYFVAALCVWLACYRRYHFNPGELGRVMLLAVDSDQADVLYSYVIALVDSIPSLKAMVTRRSVRFGMRRVEFSTKVEILIKTADKRRVRGRTIVAVVADEIAHWFSEEHHQNPDKEVLGAVRPGMLGVPGALLIAISSPYRRAGELFETDQRVWGKNGSPVLFIRAATWVMRPDTPEHHARYPTFTEELEAERERDPDFYWSEYGALYRVDLEDYLTLEQVQAVTVERAEIPWSAGMRCRAFIDTSGGEGQDSQVLAVGYELPEQRGAVCFVKEWRPKFDAMEAAREVVEALDRYNVTMLIGDNYGGANFASMLSNVSGRRIHYEVETKTKTMLYRGFASTVTGRLIELPGVGETAQRGLHQIIRLEKRHGGDVIDHPKREHDDVANALAGLALLLCSRETRKKMFEDLGNIERALNPQARNPYAEVGPVPTNPCIWLEGPDGARTPPVTVGNPNDPMVPHIIQGLTLQLQTDWAVKGWTIRASFPLPGQEKKHGFRF